jgi:hypothetical protein
MVDWILANKEWLFSGLGLTIVIGISAIVKGKPISPASSKPSIVINNQNNSGIPLPEKYMPELSRENIVKKSLDSFKNETHILFIDDDVRFKVTKILVKSGWVHTKLVKDATTLDDPDITRADILFIDVQGVGVSMGFNDEGLGLALAIKEKYPQKKVVIYSAETKGDRFHQALRKADASLPKNADPYEFQKIVEDFTIGLKEVAA